MTGGFWAGSIPPWAYPVGACLYMIAVLLGAWFGYGRGWAECEEDQGWAREQAKARRTHPVYRQPRSGTADLSGIHHHLVPLKGLEPLEVAHEAWLAHEEQALAIANDRSIGGIDDQPSRTIDRIDLRPDLTDSQWMAYKLADLDQYMAGLLGTHPATEELT